MSEDNRIEIESSWNPLSNITSSNLTIHNMTADYEGVWYCSIFLDDVGLGETFTEDSDDLDLYIDCKEETELNILLTRTPSTRL